MELGHNWTGTQWDLDTMGVGHYGTKTLAIHRAGKHWDSDTGKELDWHTIRLGQNGPGTLWD